jgi:hypothetical protein
MKTGHPAKTIKVANILTPTKLVLNAGSANGIEWWDRFLIYQYGPMVEDPDTGEQLELVVVRKGTGKVVSLQDKICTIESDSYVPSSTFGGLAALSFADPNPKLMPFEDPERGDLAFFLKPGS